LRSKGLELVWGLKVNGYGLRVLGPGLRIKDSNLRPRQNRVDVRV
jgi:hypothetical protein